MRKIVVAAVIAIWFVAARTSAADETNLIFSTIALPNTATAAMYHEWSDKINAAGKGVVHLDARDGFTLANSDNYYDRLLSDVVQITFGSPNYIAGKFPLSQVIGLPFQFNSSEESSIVYWRLYKSGMLDREFDQVVPLALVGFPQTALHFVKRPQKPLVDLKGLRIIVSGKTRMQTIAALGATTMSVPLTDTYQVLARGTADGMTLPMAATHDFKIDEASHYHLEGPLGGGPGGIWMAKAKFDALPANVRKILIDNSGEAESRRLGYLLDQRENDEPKLIEAMPNQVVTRLTAEQTQKWNQAMAPIYETWDTADGAKATAILAKLREIDAQLRAEQ